MAVRQSRLSGLSRNVSESLKQLCHDLADEVPVTGVVIDMEYWHPEQDRDAGSSYTAVFVGNAEPTKNLELLIRAAGELRRRGTPIRIRVTTELQRTSGRTAVSNLMALATELGVGDDLIGSGVVADMRSVLAGADVHVAPFLSTQGPSDYFVSTLEAMAMSKAVIVSALPGMCEVIEDGVNGLLINPSSVDELVAALLHLRDEGRRTELGASAHRVVGNLFAPPVVLKRVQEIYDSV